MGYTEEEYLQLSGIQHFLFCRRQWALIHIEKQWVENILTIEGDLLHKKVHDPDQRTKRGDVVTLRGLRVHSSGLGFSGECDAVDFFRSEDGIPLHGREGKWMPYPVEYKRGSPKQDICDEAQLCAQAMCLEEMLCCDIPEGAFYYGETRHRLIVPLTASLRQTVTEASDEMHQLYKRGYTPKVKPTKSCKACSLKDICLPKLTRSGSVDEYLKQEGGLLDA